MDTGNLKTAIGVKLYSGLGKGNSKDNIIKLMTVAKHMVPNVMLIFSQKMSKQISEAVMLRI